MNSLQIGLIVVGVLVVTILGLWSWWQTRRTRAPEARLTQSAEVESPKHVEPIGDVVHQVRVEPEEFQVRVGDKVIDKFESYPPNRVAAVTAVATDASTPVSARQTSAPDDAAEIEDAVPPLPPAYVAPPAAARVAPIPVAQAEPITATASSVSMDELPFDQRLHVHAILERDDGLVIDVAPFLRLGAGNSVYTKLFRQSPWEVVDISQPTAAAHKICLAVPIASRAGSVTTSEFEAWRTQIAVEGARQNCLVDFQGFTGAQARSEELDQFLVAVDCVPVIYLLRKDGAPWSGTRLRGTLEANGFRLQTDGRFAYYEVGSEDVIFYAVDGYERAFTPEQLRTDSVTAFRLVMEVALLKNPLQRFDTYRQTLRALSKLLDADLKDSTGAAVGEPQFAEMREQVKTAAEALADAGITPGSAAALTLLG